MPKPSPALLDPARYPFRCTIEPRFGDLDTNMHINNVSLTQILEDARVRFHRTSGFHEAFRGMTSMVASFAVEYLGQSYYPDALTIHVAPSRLGRTSYDLDQLVLQRGGAIAYARSVMVCVEQDRPAELPAAFRVSVTPWMLCA
jgi:acyl-CoA thioester hydrolase